MVIFARELGTDPAALSQRLLDRALEDAVSCLDPEAREQARAEFHARLVQELETSKERVRFEGGAP
ncbi:MAG: hypothetical protein ACREV7_19090 [Steroidobacteraceae bacterium]